MEQIFKFFIITYALGAISGVVHIHLGYSPLSALSLFLPCIPLFVMGEKDKIKFV